jgi:signal transduction histidine kinase
MTDPADERSSLRRWQRLLLPGDLLEAPGARSARDWIVDSVLFALALGVGVGALAQTWSAHTPFALAVDLLLGIIACLSLWLRRSQPVGVGVFAVAAAAVSGLAAGAAPIAVFNVAVRGSRRALVTVIGLSLAALAIYPLLYQGAGDFGTEVLIGMLIMIVAVGWGLFARVRRELVLSLRERAERLESAQRLQAEQAREAERRRIAREMHDVLAHRLSLLSVQAGALEFRPDASPAEIAEATGVIRATARAALQELREVIGVLREEADEGGPQPPQPTLAQIPALLEESRAAGMHVRWHIDAPDAAAVPPALGRTAYRVVQEGLTNARKHAPAAAVEVTIAARAGSPVRVEVVSRRAVGVAAAQTPGDMPLPGAGTGLVGLAERVGLAGGDLRYGPDAEGDFVVRATLPWTG